MNQDPLFWNKVAGAVLAAGLLAMLAGFVARLIYHPEMPEQMGYAIEGVETTPQREDAAPAGPEPIAGLLAQADLASGEQVFRKCAACHSIEEGGPNKIGPNLWDVVGRDKAGVEGFNYSSAMQGAEGTWSYEDLNHYLYNPRQFVPGTKMTFAGLKKPEDRADVIAFMRTHANTPQPLPE